MTATDARIEALCAAHGIDASSVERVVVDLRRGREPRLFVARYGAADLLELPFPPEWLRVEVGCATCELGAGCCAGCKELAQ